LTDREARARVQILKSVAIPVDLNDRDTLIKSATTSLSSKVISMHSSLLAPMAVDCVLAVSEDCRKYAAPPRRA
jgi:T-complex protein 1 subunit delta